ncbi:YncE family protein [Actinosynnema sp. NPDC050436]|uniref:YncE family protein n=1 Tax=Actinosynnema sp. NPDC050436 TaxID=3155659 RepID=UPI003411E4D1
MTAQLAVACQDASTIAFFDAHTHDRVAALAVPPQPHELIYDHDRRLLVCTHTYRSGHYGEHGESGHEVSLVDPDTHEVVEVLDVGHAPHGVALRENLLFVGVEATDDQDGGVVVVDLDKREVLDRVDVRAREPHWIAVTGRKVYTANKDARFVTAVDLPSGAVEEIGLPGSEGIAAGGRYVYVATPRFGTAGVDRGVRVVDSAVDRVVRILPTRQFPVPVHVTRGGLVLVGELDRRGGGALSAFREWEPVARVEVGRFPLAVTSSPDGALGYVANLRSGTVSVVDLTAFEVVAEIAVAPEGTAGPHGLAYVP